MQRTKSFIAAMLSVAVTCCMIFAVSLTFAGFRAGAAEEPASDPVWEHRESEHPDATALTEEYLAEHENILGDGKYYLNGAGFVLASPLPFRGTFCCACTAARLRRRKGSARSSSSPAR